MGKRVEHWRHVFKLDPAKEIGDAALQRLAASGTDAFIIGGTTGVTRENTYHLLTRIRQYSLPIVLEVSAADAVVLGFDRYMIPVVLNAGAVDWIVGQHQQVVKQFLATPMPWDDMIAEAYVILNPTCAAAQLTEAATGLGLDDIVAYAKLAEHFYQFPIFYMEYSGSFGHMDWVHAVRENLDKTRLFYGGGINSVARAKRALAAADTIVVGNVIYENLDNALATVAAAQS